MDSKQKKHNNDELLDAVIKSAFTEVFQKEMEELEAESANYDDKRPSEEHLRIERQAYKKTQRKPVAFWNVSRRIVASILVVLGLGGIVLFCVPEIKASVVDTVIEFFENYVGFDFSTNKTEIQLGEHTLYYLPKGYELTDSMESRAFSQYVFTCESEHITLKCMKSDISRIETDDEHYTIQSIDIPNYTAYALLPNDPDRTTMIVWGNESQAFIIDGNLSLKELMRVVKSFK